MTKSSRLLPFRNRENSYTLSQMQKCRLNPLPALCPELFGLIRQTRFWVYVIVLLCSILAPVIYAKSTQPTTENPTKNNEIHAAQLAAARKNITTDTTLSESQKQKALSLYDQANTWLQDYLTTKKAQQQLSVRITHAPERIKQLRKPSAKTSESQLKVSPATNLGQLQLQISQAQADLNQTQTQLKQQQEIRSRLQVGAKGMGEKMTQLSQKIAKIDTDLQAPMADEPDALTQARTLSLQIKRQLYRAKLELIKQELGHLDLLTDLAQVEQANLEAHMTAQRRVLKKLQQVAQKQQATAAREAVQQAEAIRAKSANLPTSLQKIAENSAKLQLERGSLIRKENTLATDLQRIQQQAKNIQEDFTLSQNRVQAVGPTRAIGRMLKRRRSELPLLRAFEHTSRDRIKAIEKATERQIDIEDQLRPLNNLHTEEQRVLAKLSPDLGETIRTALKQKIQELLKANKNALEALQAEYSLYISQLVQLQVAEKALVKEAQSYADFIDKQLIWIPNAGLKPLLYPSTWISVLGWISDPGNWQSVIQDSLELVQQHPAPLLLLLAFMWFLVISRRHARQQLQEIAHETRRIRSDHFLLTLRALWITLGIAIPIPLLMITLSWGIMNQPGSHLFSQAIAGGVLNLGILLGVVKFLLNICRENGLGDSHLRWPLPLRTSLTRELHWMLPVSLPLVFAIGASYAGHTPETVQSVGQLAFILLMLLLTTALIRFLRSESPVMVYLRAKKPRSWIVQLHFFWYPLVIITPLALGLTAVLGYYYTAVQFGQRLRMTIWLFLSLALTRDLLLRWFYIAERRLRLADAIKRRDEQRASQLAKRQDEGISESLPEPISEEPEVDYNQLSEQSRRLVWVIFLFSGLFGAWSIWIDLLPNLRFLNQMTLPFIVDRVVDGIPREQPITLGDITTGLLVIMVTILAAKNLPGLLEIAILRRLPITSGARYAITTLAQYAIAGIGLFIAFSSIGIQWSNIQWLVAALSVGVGFGLQEIVANFVSGIILLFEQPIRVGDVVTVNNTIGTVSRLQMRATTIVNRDQQELIVPNKAFITSEVLNWTLSDNVNRRIITVGIAYGSNVALAMKLMADTAKAHPNVLEDPPPYTAFEEFGDNALILRLRAFLKINSMRERRQITSDIYEGINQRFNDAHIVIAFPQLDVHLAKPTAWQDDHQRT